MSLSTLTFDQIRLMAKDEKAFQKRNTSRFTKDAIYSVAGIVLTFFVLALFVYLLEPSTKKNSTDGEDGEEIEVRLEHLNSIVDPKNQIDAEDA